MDVRERLRVDPFIVHVIDFEGAIGGDTDADVRGRGLRNGAGGCTILVGLEKDHSQ